MLPGPPPKIIWAHCELSHLEFEGNNLTYICIISRLWIPPGMEFECKRLQQRLDSLRSDKNKKIRSWTEHVTEFGNTIVIKFSNKSKPTRESQPLIPRTTGSNAVLSSQIHESSDASHSAEEKTDTRESSRSTSTTDRVI